MVPSDFYLTQLSNAWRQTNASLFGGALLISPTFRLTDMRHHAADWCAATREIRVSRSFVENRPWVTVLEVVKHEMAHQYVSDVLGVTDESAHGPAFRMICARFAIDPRASGTTVRSAEEEHAVDTVKKLFALGASPNKNEATAALAKAQRMLQRLGLEEGDLQGSKADDHGVAHVGGVVLRKRPEEFRAVLSHILSAHFRTRNIWVPTFNHEGRAGLQLEAVGRRCDLAVAEYTHGFLEAEALRLWGHERGGARDRLDFLEGVMRGHLETLDAEDRQRTESARGTAPPGLIHLAHAKADVDDYFDRRNPSRSSIGGGRRQRGATFDEGLSAGRQLIVSKPIAGSGPMLLGRAARS